MVEKVSGVIGDKTIIAKVKENISRVVRPAMLFGLKMVVLRKTGYRAGN